jgi:hypothetical protein
MRVFISWSGERSKRLAEAIRDWLPITLKYVKPYCTSADIEKGAKWESEISKELEVSRFCIIALTREGLNSKWIMFEAGAISRSAQVCPILFDIQQGDVEGPLKMFQATNFVKKDFHHLLKTINSNAGDVAIKDETLNVVFESSWPHLEHNLSEILRDYPSSDQLNLLVSKISPFAGTQFDIAGSGNNDRALEDFVGLLETLSKAGWEQIDWIWDTEGDTFQMPFLSSKHRYGVRTGITNVVVQAAMYGDKNAAADALANALNEIGIPATREFANNTNSNRNAVHLLIGPKR